MKMLHELRFKRSCCRIGRVARGRRRRHPSKCNSAIDTFTPEYDLDGNQTKILTSTGEWQVEYNAENRPVRWTHDDTVITMGYDRMGRRVFYKEMDGDTQITHTVFLYNGYCCIQQLFSNSPWNVYKEFIWDPTEPVATRPLVFRQNGQTSTFLMHDGNKNVTDVVTVAPNNEVVGHYEYAPFGAITTQTGTRTLSNPYRFSSEFHDDTLGLVYYNYRHYNPKDGRWLTRDLIEEEGGCGLYVFCVNSSILHLDVLGLETKEEEICDRDNEYAIRTITTMAFSLKDEDPDYLKDRLNAVIALLLMSDVVNSSDLPSLALSDINTLLGLYPSGSEVAAELLKNYDTIVKSFMRHKQVDVWSKVQCQECKCTNSFSSFLGLRAPEYEWETVEESEWIKCDIRKTAWGKKAKRRGYPKKVKSDGSIVYFLLSKKDREDIHKQCGKQAKKYCEEEGWL